MPLEFFVIESGSSEDPLTDILPAKLVTTPPCTANGDEEEAALVHPRWGSMG
jgi:hypothetical protein